MSDQAPAQRSRLEAQFEEMNGYLADISRRMHTLTNLASWVGLALVAALILVIYLLSSDDGGLGVRITEVP